MIRFCNLTGQLSLDNDEKAFAFFDTVIDKFCTFNDNQTWTTVEEFTEDFKLDDETRSIDRFLRLIPQDFNQ